MIETKQLKCQNEIGNVNVGVSVEDTVWIVWG